MVNARPVVLALAGILLAGCTALATPSTSPARSRAATPGPSVPAASSGSVASTPGTAAFAFPARADGLPVHGVSDLLDGRASGRLKGGPYALAGYWSTFGWAHSCPSASTGALEIYCHDGEFGISENDAPILLVHQLANMIYTEPGPSGPKLTPYVPDALYARLQLPLQPSGQAYPVPIVVIGHFDDPAAKDCRPEARKLCEDRFVIDRVVTLAVDAVAPPSPTPSPTPYRPGPSEAPPFRAETCIAGTTSTPPSRSDFSFVGWMDGGDLHLTSGLDLTGITVYAAITRDAVPLGEWFREPGDARESLAMGRLVCYAFGGVPGGGVALDSIAGSAYRLYRDGSTSAPR